MKKNIPIDIKKINKIYTDWRPPLVEPILNFNNTALLIIDMQHGGIEIDKKNEPPRSKSCGEVHYPSVCILLLWCEIISGYDSFP